MYSIIDIDEWRDIVRAREARGARTALVVSGIPFTVTDEYVPTLLPYLKKYGELDSYHINTSRTADGTPDGSITFGFFSGGQPLPAQRPAVPIVLNHKYIFSLSPMLGQVRVLAHGDNRINNCTGCPAIGMPFILRCKDRAACEASARAKVAAQGTEPPKPKKPKIAKCCFGHVASEAEMAAAAEAAPSGMAICRNYMTEPTKGCRWGDKCKFFHFKSA